MCGREGYVFLTSTLTTDKRYLLFTSFFGARHLGCPLTSLMKQHPWFTCLLILGLGLAGALIARSLLGTGQLETDFGYTEDVYWDIAVGAEPTYNAPHTFSCYSYYIENDSHVEVRALYEFSDKTLNADDNSFVVAKTINEFGQWLPAMDPDQDLNDNTEGTLGIDLTDYDGTYRIYAYTRLELYDNNDNAITEPNDEERKVKAYSASLL